MAKTPQRHWVRTPHGHQAIRDRNQDLYNRMLVRRAALRVILETNYGIHLNMRQIGDMLIAQGHSGGAGVLRDDFREMNVELVKATVNGKSVKFYAISAHAADRSPEDMRHAVPSDIIESEAYKEILQCVSDVFQDGKRVVILTAYERAKHLALWLRNLGWPEIWYIAKEDGSTVVIETRSEQRAKFLLKRIWGFARTEAPEAFEEHWGGKKDE